MGTTVFHGVFPVSATSMVPREESVKLVVASVHANQTLMATIVISVPLTTTIFLSASHVTAILLGHVAEDVISDQDSARVAPTSADETVVVVRLDSTIIRPVTHVAVTKMVQLPRSVIRIMEDAFVKRTSMGLDVSDVHQATSTGRIAYHVVAMRLGCRAALVIQQDSVAANAISVALNATSALSVSTNILNVWNADVMFTVRMASRVTSRLDNVTVRPLLKA